MTDAERLEHAREIADSFGGSYTSIGVDRDTLRWLIAKSEAALRAEVLGEMWSAPWMCDFSFARSEAAEDLRKALDGYGAEASADD